MKNKTKKALQVGLIDPRAPRMNYNTYSAKALKGGRGEETAEETKASHFFPTLNFFLHR